MNKPKTPLINVDDMLQSAYEGLWKACLSFDESLGYQFSTYAVPTIKGQIMREFRSISLVHIPRSFMEIRTIINRHKFTLPLTDEQIDIIVAEGCRLSRKLVEEYVEPEVLSLDNVISEDGSGTFAESIPDTTSLPYESLSEDELDNAIEELVKLAPKDHKDMIEEWLYAKRYDEKCGQVELSRKYKICQAQVSRVINKFKTKAVAIEPKILELLGA